MPAPPKDPSQLGLGIQRTMTLLATSTPEHRHHVKILFYGQSITEQEWSKHVAADLRRRFPYADLEIENRAIGGFASQLLIRPAEHDLYPFYPDLLIFHVYGANQQYEQIIHSVRSRTTAEVMMQNDHLTKWPPADDRREKGQGSVVGGSHEPPFFARHRKKIRLRLVRSALPNGSNISKTIISSPRPFSKTAFISTPTEIF